MTTEIEPMTKTESTAKETVKTLTEGDIIRVSQYSNALEVTHTGELNGEENAFIGVEFSDEAKKTSANKSMVVNQNSGRVYLSAGTSDKGEVKTIEVVAAVEETEDDDETDETEADNTEEVAADGGTVTTQTTEDTPEVGQKLEERTHYGHVRYASRDSPGVIWYDPRDGRENFSFDVDPMAELDVGESTVTHAKIRPFRPSEYGEPADKYVVKITRTEKELFKHDTEPFETTRQYGSSEQYDSLEAARDSLRERFDEYATAPRNDAVRSRTD